jgi:hypothetical protein
MPKTGISSSQTSTDTQQAVGVQDTSLEFKDQASDIDKAKAALAASNIPIPQTSGVRDTSLEFKDRKEAVIVSDKPTVVLPDQKFGIQNFPESKLQEQISYNTRNIPYKDTINNISSEAGEIIGRSLRGVAFSIPRTIADIVTIVGENPGMQRLFGTDAPPAFDKWLNDQVVPISNDVSEFFSQKEIDVLAPIRTDDGKLSWQEYLSYTTQGGATLLASLGIYSMTKSTALASWITNSLEATSEYTNAKNAGKTNSQSLLISATSLVATSILDKAGLDFMIKKLGGGMLTNIILKSFAEGGQEATQTWVQNLIAKLGYDKTRDLLSGTFTSFIVSLPLGAIGGGFSEIATPGSVNISKNKMVQSVKKIDPDLTNTEAKAIAAELHAFATQKTGEIKTNLESISKPISREGSQLIEDAKNAIQGETKRPAIFENAVNEVKANNGLLDIEFKPVGINPLMRVDSLMKDVNVGRSNFNSSLEDLRTEVKRLTHLMTTRDSAPILSRINRVKTKAGMTRLIEDTRDIFNSKGEQITLESIQESVKAARPGQVQTLDKAKQLLSRAAFQRDMSPKARDKFLKRVDNITTPLRARNAIKKLQEISTGKKVVNIKETKDIKPSLGDGFYELNIKPSKTSIFKDIKTTASDAAKGLDEFLGAISTRLGNINPGLKRLIREFEFTTKTNVARDLKRIDGFFKKVKTMSKMDFAMLDLATKNGDKTKIDQLAEKYDMADEIVAVRDVLNQLYDTAQRTGLPGGYFKNYWPRKVKDSQGLVEYFSVNDPTGMIEAAINAKQDAIQGHLTVAEKSALINTLMRGYKSSSLSLSQVGNMKTRRIDVIDRDINQFYQSSVGALSGYIHEMHHAIQTRKLFGKGAKNMEDINLNDTIGAFTLELIAKGEINPSQEQELRDIFTAYFNKGHMGPTMALFRNLSYVDVMGSFLNSVTQIGDFAPAAYRNGLFPVGKAIAKSLVRKPTLRTADIGITEIAREFSDDTRSAWALNAVFNATGLKAIDTLGKEVLINSTIDRMQKASKTPQKGEFMDRLKEVFGNDKERLDLVTQDLQNGVISDDVKRIAFNALLDMQPVTDSEMPQKYLESGNGKILYMLKTYTIKQLDIYRTEIFQEMPKNPARALNRMIRLTTMLLFFNATADEIKAFMIGKTIDLKDATIDNIAMLFGFSNYDLYLANSRGVGAALTSKFAPPFKLMDGLWRDARSIYKDVNEDGVDVDTFRTLESIQSVPLFGRLYYWWFGKGKDKIELSAESDRKKKQFKVTSGNGFKAPSLPSFNVPSANIPSLF